MYSPFTKITYILTFLPPSLEQFLRAFWNAVSWAIVLILPQIKLDSQLSRSAIFFGWQNEHVKQSRTKALESMQKPKGPGI